MGSLQTCEVSHYPPSPRRQSTMTALPCARPPPKRGRPATRATSTERRPPHAHFQTNLRLGARLARLLQHGSFNTGKPTPCAYLQPVVRSRDPAQILDQLLSRCTGGLPLEPADA